MTDRTEGFVHGASGADQHVRVAPHITGNQYRLADGAIAGGNLGMPGGKGPGRPLAVHTESPPSAFDLVLFPLGDIVTDVVNEG